MKTASAVTTANVAKIVPAEKTALAAITAPAMTNTAATAIANVNNRRRRLYKPLSLALKNIKAERFGRRPT